MYDLLGCSGSVMRTDDLGGRAFGNDGAAMAAWQGRSRGRLLLPNDGRPPGGRCQTEPVLSSIPSAAAAAICGHSCSQRGRASALEPAWGWCLGPECALVVREIKGASLALRTAGEAAHRPEAPKGKGACRLARHHAAVERKFVHLKQPVLCSDKQ